MHTFHCTGCSRQLTVSDEVFEQRMSGKKAAVRCKHCSTPLTEVACEPVRSSGPSSSTRSGAGPVAASKPTAPALRRTVVRPLAASHTQAAASPLRHVAPHPATHPTQARATAALRVTAAQPVARTISQVSVDATPSSVRLSATHVDPIESPDPSSQPAARYAVSRSQELEIVKCAASEAELKALLVPTNSGDSPKSDITSPSATESPDPEVQENGVVSATRSASEVHDSESPAMEVSDDELLHDWELAVTAATGKQVISGGSSSTRAGESSMPIDSTNPQSETFRAVELDLPTRVMTIDARTQLASEQVRALPRVVSRLVSRLNVSRLDAALMGVNLLILVTAVLVLPRWGAESEGSSQAAAQPIAAEAPKPAVVVVDLAAPAVVAKPPAPTESTIPSTSTTPAVESAAPRAQAPAEVAKTSQANVEQDAIPSYASRPAVIHLTGIAMRRAQGCHPRGHAVGTALVFVTFDPNGTVSAARLEGEPLASAPVSRCILDHARSIRIPRFHGEPFTYSQSVTLR